MLLKPPHPITRCAPSSCWPSSLPRITVFHSPAFVFAVTLLCMIGCYVCAPQTTYCERVYTGSFMIQVSEHTWRCVSFCHLLFHSVLCFRNVATMMHEAAAHFSSLLPAVVPWEFPLEFIRFLLTNTWALRSGFSLTNNIVRNLESVSCCPCSRIALGGALGQNGQVPGHAHPHYARLCSTVPCMIVPMPGVLSLACEHSRCSTPGNFQYRAICNLCPSVSTK